MGDPCNYVEPFFGSGAVMLGRPTAPCTETVNDKDCLLANFWRALKHDPEGVAAHADWPVNEADLHARHRWLVNQVEFRERMRSDPDHYDAKIAGWWVWGISMWIGGGWCKTPEDGAATPIRKPHSGAPGEGGGLRGVHRGALHQEDATPKGQMPHLGNAGMDSHAGVAKVHENRPALGSSSSSGVLGPIARTRLVEEFVELAARFRDVRVCCGDWSRVLTPAVTTGHGLTGVLLDPPYEVRERSTGIYANDGEADLCSRVRAWAIENGENPLMRIVYCGYADGPDEELTRAGWRAIEWKAAGGFGGQRKDGTNENKHRERLWLSKHCLVKQNELFA